MSLAGFAPKRLYTIISQIMPVCMLAVGAVRWTPTDIFPEINIPVVSAHEGADASRAIPQLASSALVVLK